MMIVAATLFYLLPGIIGHDPWKQDETYTFGMVHHLLTTGEWLIPMNAGEPFMEKPPLYVWVAAAMAWLFHPVLPLHDGARLATLLFAGTAVIFTGLAAKSAFQTRSWHDGRVVGTMALWMGTLVCVKHLHDMFSDVALVAGAAMAFHGLQQIVTRTASMAPAPVHPPHDAHDVHDQAPPARRSMRVCDAMLFGVGVGIALMSKGVFIPAVFTLTTLALPLLLKRYRNASYARAVGLAILISLPFALIWPALLYHASPSLFMTWFWDNNVGRFLGFSVAELGSDNERGFIYQALLTSGFPVWPIAIAGLVMGGAKRLLDRTDPLQPARVTSLVFMVIGIAVLAASATARQLYLLPFVLPAALLAADTIDRLPGRPGCVNFWTLWDYFSRCLFGVAGLAVWAVWFVMLQALPVPWFLAFLSKWLPLGYQIPFQPWAVGCAALLSAAWAGLLLKGGRVGAGRVSIGHSDHGGSILQSRWRGAVSWFAGVTLVWGLVFTLLLPWLDRAKSYGPVFHDLAETIQADWKAGDCMASRHLGESEAPMLSYFAGIVHQPEDRKNHAPTTCRWLIVQGKAPQADVSSKEWEPVWAGARDGDTNEILRVYRRRP